MAIGRVNMLGYTPKEIREPNKTTAIDDTSFRLSLNAATDLLKATQEAENVSTNLTYDFITGQSENIHDLMIAQEKSSTMLSFTMKVQNKIMTAYNEIIKIPV
ncbi:flagellar hook-basal body complex protein FliE [Candidatus Epulonipiscium viviparus]|uniref:flagellar hook-basal body complex protein FliE n=1 Tax=Candidatus Epulonipiscium viviparus TaxID=420336 RepID=UPI00016C0A0A|nr:flagellar hook-basal body complex protein FliE [Candidatus Epulopiscium viviparus]